MNFSYESNFNFKLMLTNCICEARDLGLVRPLPMTKSTEKFEFERKHSQRLGA
jgi:hypothetical protein